MGEINIRFRMNMETGKKDIEIEFESDEDAMRHEHEKRHRQIVEQLVGQGVLEPEEVGDVKVTRVEPGARKREPEQGAGPEAQANTTG